MQHRETDRKTAQHHSQFWATVKEAKRTKPNRRHWHRTLLTSSSIEVTPTSFLLDMEPRCHILSIYSWKRTRLLADSCPLSAVDSYHPHLPKGGTPYLSKQVSLTFFYNYERTTRSYRKSRVQSASCHDAFPNQSAFRINLKPVFLLLNYFCYFFKFSISFFIFCCTA